MLGKWLKAGALLAAGLLAGASFAPQQETRSLSASPQSVTGDLAVITAQRDEALAKLSDLENAAKTPKADQEIAPQLIAAPKPPDPAPPPPVKSPSADNAGPPKTPVAASPTGYYATVPIYGPLGRQRGTQRVWVNTSKVQYVTYQTGQTRAGACAGGSCSTMGRRRR